MELMFDRRIVCPALFAEITTDFSLLRTSAFAFGSLLWTFAFGFCFAVSVSNCLCSQLTFSFALSFACHHLLCFVFLLLMRFASSPYQLSAFARAFRVFPSVQVFHCLDKFFSGILRFLFWYSYSL